jgi:hypothetical protein
VPRLIPLVLAAVLVATSVVSSGAQSRRAAPRAAVRTTQPADVTCPAPLGLGVRTGRQFCDVLAGRDATGGILVRLPPRKGVATLTFDLHNRHTYSAEEERSGHAYARYTATIGVLTLDVSRAGPANTLLSRFVVRNEFRHEQDLFDRVSGGSGPGGVKAVAPTGVETVVLDIPEGIQAVSILGEMVTTARAESERNDVISTPGRPVAIVSQIMVEFTPAPAPVRKPARRRSSHG